MERRENTSEYTPSGAITSLESARYLDTLEPAYEEAWETFTQSATDITSEQTKIYGEIWANHQLPQIFRDRALRHIISKDAIVNVASWTRPGLTGGASNINHNHLEASVRNDYWYAKNHTEIATWILESTKYEQENGIEIIPPSAKYTWACLLFDKSYLDKEEFESLLETFDPADVSPTITDYDRKDLSDSANTPLKDRFPYLEHIFINETARPNMVRLHEWAEEKIMFWLDNYDNDMVLPSWMRSVDRDTALPFVQLITNILTSDQRRRTDLYPVDLLKSARKLYDWKELIVFNGRYSSQDCDILGMTLLMNINGHEELEEDLLLFLTRGKSYVVQSTEAKAYLEKVARRINNPTLLQRIHAAGVDPRQAKIQSISAHETTYETKLKMSITSLKESIEYKRAELRRTEASLELKIHYKGLLELLQRVNAHGN